MTADHSRRGNTINIGKTDEQIQEDMADQFEEMYYTVECNECGEKIVNALISDDFNRPGLIKGPEGIQDAMEAHNMTHYEKPR